MKAPPVVLIHQNISACFPSTVDLTTVSIKWKGAAFLQDRIQNLHQRPFSGSQNSIDGIVARKLNKDYPAEHQDKKDPTSGFSLILTVMKGKL
ncbi:MAG: hypothetical protein ACJ75B_15485 [Flavisolibacter sp.]